MRKYFAIALLAILILFAFSAPALSQDVTEPPVLPTIAPDVTEAAAPEPPVIVVPAVFDSPTVFAIFLVVFIIGSGFVIAVRERNVNRLLNSIDTALADKRIRDEAERRYMESSLPVHQVVDLFKSFVVVVNALNLPGVDTTVDNLDKFLKDATDGQANA